MKCSIIFYLKSNKNTNRLLFANFVISVLRIKKFLLFKTIRSSFKK